MGRLTGTEPEDDPFVAAERGIGRREGEAAGIEVGRREGFREGEAAGLEAGHRKGFREGEAAGIETGHRKGFREGESAGVEIGRREGREEGLIRERLATVESLLTARNIPVARQLSDHGDRIAALPHEAVFDAAIQSRDFADFLRRIQ